MILPWNIEKNLKNFSKTSVFIQYYFYSVFIQFSGSTTVYMFHHNLVELWPRMIILSTKFPSRMPLKVSRRHTYGNPSRLRDIGKDIRGVKMTPLFMCVYVDQKSLVFLFESLKESDFEIDTWIQKQTSLVLLCKLFIIIIWLYFS